jgi:hypothetical protein
LAFCTQCGKTLREGAKFCTQCGTKVRNVSRSPSRPATNTQPLRSEQTSQQKPTSRTPIVFQTRQKPLEAESTQNNVTIDEKKDTEISIEQTIETPPSIIESPIDESTEIDVKEEEQTISENGDTRKIDHKVADKEIPEDSTKKQLKDQLQRIKYSFREIEEVKPFIFQTTFIAGSIKQLVWDFSKGFTLFASLPESVNPDIIFTLELEKERKPYDWKNPYANISFSNKIENEAILKKIKREGRVVEKLSRLNGAVKAEIVGKKVTLEIKSVIPENIRLGLDAIKELAWLLDITLK